MNTAAFAAIADPTRRHIIEILHADGWSTATQLAGQLNMTRQAVSKHLALLTNAGIAAPTKVGRETRYRPEPHALEAVRDWVDVVEATWNRRVTRLAQSIERQ